MCDKEIPVSVLAEYQLHLQLYAQAAARFRLTHPGLVATSPAAAAAAYNAVTNGNGYAHPTFAESMASLHGLSPFASRYDSRFRLMNEEPKPQHSYIGLIAMAILSSSEQKMVLSDIYQYILDNYPYFRTRGHGWRNSIRHNLSLNDCFIKSGRSPNGKGHYWAIHPANIDDFKKGDFRRRKAQRKVRKHLGLSVPEDDDSSSPTPTPANGPSTPSNGSTIIPANNASSPLNNNNNNNAAIINENGEVICSSNNNSSTSLVNVISHHHHSNHNTFQLVNGCNANTQIWIENMAAINSELMCVAVAQGNKTSESCNLKINALESKTIEVSSTNNSASVSPVSSESSSKKEVEITTIETSSPESAASKSRTLQKASKRQFDVESLLAPDSRSA